MKVLNVYCRLALNFNPDLKKSHNTSWLPFILKILPIKQVKVPHSGFILKQEESKSDASVFKLISNIHIHTTNHNILSSRQLGLA